MDALVDLEIAELEIVMEQQGLEGNFAGDFYGGEDTFTPEIFLSHGSIAYDPMFGPFETEWLALQLAPDASNATKTSSDIFNEDDGEDEVIAHGTLSLSGGGGFAGFISAAAASMIQAHLAADDGSSSVDEIIVTGDRTQAEQEQFYYNFLDNMNWIGGAQMIFGPGDIRDVLRVPEGSRVYNESGELLTPSETVDGVDIYSGNDGPNSSWDRVPDGLEGGRIVIQSIAGSYTIPIPGPLIFL